LHGYGLGEVEAADTVATLATFEVPQARDYLARRGLNRSQQDDVLASSHCTPPSSYLVLSSAMNSMPGWRFVAKWDLHRAATDVGGGAVPEAGYVVNHWLPCRATEAADEVCFFGLGGGEGGGSDPGARLEAIVFDPSAPSRIKLRLRAAFPANNGRRVEEAAPSAILVAGADKVWEEPGCARAPCVNLGVLVDLARHRVLAGTPDLIRSTYTKLMFLGGRDTRWFEKVR